MFASRKTRSTYCLLVSEVARGGAEAIRNHTKAHDLLFELSDTEAQV
jgi:hypothetical protein